MVVLWTVVDIHCINKSKYKTRKKVSWENYTKNKWNTCFLLSA